MTGTGNLNSIPPNASPSYSGPGSNVPEGDTPTTGLTMGTGSQVGKPSMPLTVATPKGTEDGSGSVSGNLFSDAPMQRP